MEDVVNDSKTRDVLRLSGVEFAAIDFDGVLIDSAPAIVLCMTEAFERLHLDPPDEQSIQSIIGPPLEVGLAGLLASRSIDASRTGDLVKAYRAIYRERASVLTAVFPGVVEAVDQIRMSGRSVAVVTSKPMEITEILVDDLGLRQHFDAIECQGPRDDAKAVVLKRAVDALGVDPRLTVMVGDRSHDVQAAIDVGTMSIGVLWGYGSREELIRAGAQRLITRPIELPRLVGV